MKQPNTFELEGKQDTCCICGKTEEDLAEFFRLTPAFEEIAVRKQDRISALEAEKADLEPGAIAEFAAKHQTYFSQIADCMSTVPEGADELSIEQVRRDIHSLRAVLPGIENVLQITLRHKANATVGDLREKIGRMVDQLAGGTVSGEVYEEIRRDDDGPEPPEITAIRRVHAIEEEITRLNERPKVGVLQMQRRSVSFKLNRYGERKETRERHDDGDVTLTFKCLICPICAQILHQL